MVCVVCGVPVRKEEREQQMGRVCHSSFSLIPVSVSCVPTPSVPPDPPSAPSSAPHLASFSTPPSFPLGSPPAFAIALCVVQEMVIGAARNPLPPMLVGVFGAICFWSFMFLYSSFVLDRPMMISGGCAVVLFAR